MPLSPGTPKARRRLHRQVKRWPPGHRSEAAESLGLRRRRREPRERDQVREQKSPGLPKPPGRFQSSTAAARPRQQRRERAGARPRERSRRRRWEPVVPLESGTRPERRPPTAARSAKGPEAARKGPARWRPRAGRRRAKKWGSRPTLNPRPPAKRREKCRSLGARLIIMDAPTTFLGPGDPAGPRQRFHAVKGLSARAD